MDYVPIPLDMVAIDSPIPVDVVNSSGRLLLRKGQCIVSEQHREKLRENEPLCLDTEGRAWQRAYERMVHDMMRRGVSVEVIKRAPMPSEIFQSDYIDEEQSAGDWLDLQGRLRGILYHGATAIQPFKRILGVSVDALALLDADVDDSLLCLLQALADESLGYCATHALLCFVVCDLTARKLDMNPVQRRSLTRAALTMNIGMALEQDKMSRQSEPLSEAQRQLIADHPAISETLLRGMGVDDPDQLDIVRWHHVAMAPQGLAHNKLCRQILATADVFVAKMAGRKTRAPLSPLDAAKSIYLGPQGKAAALGSAMASAVGFYPPGSYVRLINGEIAVAVQRGARANTPWVVGLLGKDGAPLANYHCKDTSDVANAIAAPVSPRAIKVTINMDKLRKARARIPR